MRKQNNKGAFSVSSLIPRKRWLNFIAVLQFGLVGAYLVFGAKANFFMDFPPPQFYTYFEDWVEGGQGGLGPSDGWPANQDIGMEIRASFTIEPGQVKQLVVVATADSDRVNYVRYNCGIAPCSDSAWNESMPSFQGSSMYQPRSAVVCIDVPPGHYDKVNLVTIRYKSRVSLPQRNPSAAPDGWFAVASGVTDGSCNDNRSGSGVTFGSSESYEGGCGGGAFTSSCTGGPGNGTNNPNGLPSSNANNDAGDGASGESTGSGGGGGGNSTAKKQSDNPNSLPSSSGQDDGEQPEVDPSPFFDGKDYAPGSDADTFGSTLSVTGKKLVKGWYYVLGALLIGGAGGFGFWHWRQNHKLK